MSPRSIERIERRILKALIGLLICTLLFVIIALSIEILKPKPEPWTPPDPIEIERAKWETVT